MTSLRVVYKLPDMEQATVKQNITYKTIDDTELKLDVYYPAGFQHNKPLPAVIFVHGDAPAEMLKDAKSWGQYISWGQLVAATGLIAVTFNHRSAQQFTAMPDVVSDIADLIAYVRDNAASLLIDQNQLALWVASGGTPYGLSVVLEEKPDFIRCVVAYYGVMDLSGLHQYYPQLSQAALQAVSPVHHLANQPEKTPPLLVVKAALDRPQINATIDQFVAEAARQNVKLELVTHPEGQHSFDILDDNQTSRDIIQHTLEFIAEYI